MATATFVLVSFFGHPWFLWPLGLLIRWIFACLRLLLCLLNFWKIIGKSVTMGAACRHTIIFPAPFPLEILKLMATLRAGVYPSMPSVRHLYSPIACSASVVVKVSGSLRYLLSWAFSNSFSPSASASCSAIFDFLISPFRSG